MEGPPKRRPAPRSDGSLPAGRRGRSGNPGSELVSSAAPLLFGTGDVAERRRRPGTRLLAAYPSRSSHIPAVGAPPAVDLCGRPIYAPGGGCGSNLVHGGSDQAEGAPGLRNASPHADGCRSRLKGIVYGGTTITRCEN